MKIHKEILKSVYISVTNDLVSDARAHRICETLLKSNAMVTLAGSQFKRSPEPGKREYYIRRFRVPVKKGFMFYAYYNIRLLLYLLTRKKADILVACDLDTLPANYLASLLRGSELVYDSHEYFTEVPELQNRRFVRKFWETIERLIVPRLKYAYTVSHSIAAEYQEKYGVKFDVIRNLPLRKQGSEIYPLPESLVKKKKIIYQGAVNIGRGIGLMMDIVKEMSDDIVFIIVGDGDLYTSLKKKCDDESLNDRIFFTGRIPFEKLTGLTIQGDVGISLEEDLGKNYRYALPNKIFDYIQCEVPVLVSDLPELRKLVEQYNVGMITKTRDPQKIKKLLEFMLYNEEARRIWKSGLPRAASGLNWENEEIRLKTVFIRTGLTFLS